MNIFVAGLSYQITDADLKNYLEYGEVSSAKIISDRKHAVLRLWHLEMVAEEDGQRAIEELNVRNDGRTLSVYSVHVQKDLLVVTWWLRQS